MSDRQGFRKTQAEHEAAEDFIEAALARINPSSENHESASGNGAGEAKAEGDSQSNKPGEHGGSPGTPPKVLEFTSPDSTTTIYACGWCKLTVPHGTPELADACCRCKRCGNRKEDNWRIYCVKCDAEARSVRNAEERAKALTLPILEDYNGPVYVADESRYYEDQWSAAESLMFDHTAEEFADIIVHPCSVGPIPVPNLYDILNESWACEMDSDYDFEISKAAEEALAACTKSLLSEAPIVWNARTTERIVLTRPSDDD